MTQKILALALALAILTPALPALAADSGADPLGLDELRAWTEEILSLAEASELLNDPSSEEPSEDGYPYVYDFGTLYFTRPVRDGDCELTGLVLYDDAVAGPRGTNTLTSLTSLVDSFYSENESLDGSYTEALLYLGGAFPGEVWWAALQRDGQWVDMVQYAVHAPVGDDLYTDTGLVYTLQQNTVVAIRAYGVNAVITGGEVTALVEEAARLGSLSGYTLVPTSTDGAALTAFDTDDLTFSGVDFLSCTPERAVEILGEPVFVDTIEDGGSQLRVLGFDDCELVFTVSGGETSLRSVTISGDGLEGPRALRVGDDFGLATQRFRFGEGELEGSVEVLYGTPGQGSWGTVEYGGEYATATLRYGLTLSDGRQVVLMASFEMLALTEITVYIA